MKIETKVLHEGYQPKNGEPRVFPIYQSTTFTYDSTEHVGALFDLKEAGFFYSRIGNPTVDVVEKKIAALEGGVGALLTSSGQAATFLALLNILKCGDHFVSSSTIYGGTYNLFAHTFKRFGIEVTFVDQDAPLEELQKAIQTNTKAVFAETMSNPIMSVLDIEKFVALAHQNHVPFLVDNTFATPYFCQPITYGADIVIHSTTKYLDGHALHVGGVIVDGGTFDWSCGKFSELCDPDPTYHGLSYVDTFKEAAYITKARVQLMRDLGATPSPQSAFYLNVGIETLPVRMERHYANALAVANFLTSQACVEKVAFPGLESDPYHDLKQKYLPNGCCGVIAFTLKGGRNIAAKLLDNLKLISLEVHVADIRTCILHPASSTHRQLSDDELLAAGISASLIRISCGLEHVDDIIEDLKQAIQIIEEDICQSDY